MRIETTKLHKDKYTQSYSINVLEDDRCVSTARIGYVNSVFAGKYIKAMTVGALQQNQSIEEKVM